MLYIHTDVALTYSFKYISLWCNVDVGLNNDINSRAAIDQIEKHNLELRRVLMADRGFAVLQSRIRHFCDPHRQLQRYGRHRRKAGWREQLSTYTYLCILAAAEDSSSVYCNSDDSTPIWLLTVIAKEAALWAEVWAEECRKAHQGRPLSLLELWEKLKDIPSSMNTLTGTYTPASVHDCCHMLKSPQAPLTSDNMTF